MSTRDERASELYDLMFDHPDGMTKPQIMVEMAWDSNEFASAVQALRDIFATEGDTISLPCEPQGQRESWLYTLVDGGELPDEDQSRWIGIMIRHAERRIKTMANVLATAVKATRGNTILGKKARIYLLHLKRAQEEVAMLTNPDGLW